MFGQLRLFARAEHPRSLQAGAHLESLTRRSASLHRGAEAMPKLTRRKDSPNVYAWVTDPVTGRKKRVSTRERNKRTAQVIADGRERRAADPTYRSGTTTLERAIHSFITQHAARKAAGTRHMYDVKTRQLARVIGLQRQLADLDAQVVDRYIATRLGEGTSKNTIGKELTTLRGVLK